ncbi:hypothetical protein LZC95_37700 [Pendulispora brunnea]|uniref:Uncharacterized protein n=1 Tax=Pendulispora brunnea TaxID=2905690 RepID=A0ABZ2K0B3_9BACT
MMSRSRPGRVRCAFGLALVPVLAYALLGTLGACDYVAYLGNYEVRDGTVFDAGPDADADAEPGVPCGAKSCFAPSTCLDPKGEGTCSNDIVSISAGGETTCALLADATLWCWGGNQFGALGQPPEGDEQCNAGNDTFVSCRHKPSQVPGMTDVLQVSVGFQTVCAVKRNNSVWCWGNNHFGQLGHAPNEAGDRMCPPLNQGPAGTPQECNSVPVQVAGLSAVEVAVNREHACAIGTDGRVSCWGRNEALALGTTLVAPSAATPIPQSVNGLPKALHLATGVSSYHTCAITQERKAVWCWGANHSGQLGHPKSLDTECSGNCSSTARAVAKNYTDAGVSEPLENVTSLAAGYLFTCAVRDSRVYCWGGNDFGTLGPNLVEHSTSSPTQIPGMSLIREVGARLIHACAVAEDGRIFCWGANPLGSIGTGEILGEPCQTTVCRKTPYNTGLANVVGTATGAGASYALFAKRSSISAWGDNSTARLGHKQTDEGDLYNCGDLHESVCNPTPRLMPRFP